MIRAVGINKKQNNKEKNIFYLGGWKARGIPKGVSGLVLAIKAKKGEKFRSAGSTGLTALPFFCFSWSLLSPPIEESILLSGSIWRQDYFAFQKNTSSFI